MGIKARLMSRMLDRAEIKYGASIAEKLISKWDERHGDIDFTSPLEALGHHGFAAEGTASLFELMDVSKTVQKLKKEKISAWTCCKTEQRD